MLEANKLQVAAVSIIHSFIHSFALSMGTVTRDFDMRCGMAG